MDQALRAVKLVAIGDGQVGKTALLVTYSSHRFPEEYVPTVFENVTVGATFNNQCYCINIWDTAGQEEYKRLRALSYPETNVFLICFDVSCRVSYENVPHWANEVKHSTQEAKILLVGTKIDLRAEKDVETIPAEEGQKMANDIGADAYIECSARKELNVTEVFATAVGLYEQQHTKKAKKSKKHATGTL